MSRWKAAGIHLALSIVIIGLVAFGLVYLWYGLTLFKLMGGQKLLIILTSADIAIGPLLTLIVYKAGKRSLTFDMTVIALLQVGFLAYGMMIMAQSRPVFLVGAADRFELVFANELDDADLAKGKEPVYRKRSWTGPVLVGGQLGQTSKERLELALSGFAGKDVHLLPERYVEFGAVAKDLAAAAEPASTLAATSPEANAALIAAAKSIGRPLEKLATLPIVSRRARATMLVDPVTGEPLAEVALEPWPRTNAEEEEAKAPKETPGN